MQIQNILDNGQAQPVAGPAALVIGAAFVVTPPDVFNLLWSNPLAGVNNLNTHTAAVAGTVQQLTDFTSLSGPV